MKKTNNKGFSLVELIVVIAIMAVLIAVLAPSYLRYVEKSRNSTDMQNAAQLVTACQVWAVDAGIDDPTNMFTQGDYTITVTDQDFTTSSTIVDKALQNAGLMDSAGNCSMRCVSKTIFSGTPQYEITLTVRSDGTMEVKYDPAWVGGGDTAAAGAGGGAATP